MPRTFFTSDTHFRHENIIKLCNRPFAGVDEMDRAMIAAWNCVIGPRDTVHHLGDFGFQRAEDEGRLARIFAQLNGAQKHLIIGNHDKQAVFDLPWSSRPENYRELNVDGSKVVLSHYPLREWNGFYRGAIHLYGHCHSTVPSAGNSLDAGVDNWSFRPTTVAEIRARLVLNPPYDPRLPVATAQPAGQPESAGDMGLPNPR